MNEIRILTVRQPWAWAIIHAGKDVENRVRNVAGGWRGPVAIHAGLRIESEDAAAWDMDEYRDAFSRAPAVVRHRVDVRGAILGVVDLETVHHPKVGWGCPASPGDLLPMCSAWAEQGAHHLVLADPRPLAEPIPYKGALGLRRLDEETTAAVWAQIGGEHA